MKPKKAKVAFMFFVKAESQKVMKENDFKSAAPAVKLLGQKWQSMSETDKKPYLDLRDEDVLRHQKQMKEFVETGSFTMEDGTKSSDHQITTGKKRKGGDDVALTKSKKQKISEK